MLQWSYRLQNKILLRQQFRAQRRAINAAQRDDFAQAAAELFAQHPLFQTSQKIACYLARDDEFDCAPIIKKIWQAGKECYLPALSAAQEHFLDFMPYREHDELQANRYQILEPANAPRIAGESLDLVLVPLVSFDLLGNRLGMGGGYYDRTFEFLLKKLTGMPVLIGLGYETQRVDELPWDAWDVPLEGVLTESRVYYPF